MSLGDDNSAINLVTHDDGKYYVKQWVFVPEGRLDTKSAIEKIDYRTWVRKKQTFATVDEAPNSWMINYKDIENFIVNLAKEHEITHIAYDQFNAGNLVQNLQNYDSLFNTKFEIIQQNKTGRHFGISLLRQAVMQKRLFFNNSMMIYEWGAVEMKQTDNLYYVEKVKTAKNKTDMVYSLINALDVCNELYEVNQPEYADDLIFTI
ncbi:phage terminase family protein [Bacillus sp. S10C12M]|nr:phage terminase family protein [Bacillus sp. S10C12M]